ncbi:MAG: leucine-rich repeat protein, partial [Clostridiales bacterium]|nr:leucine-rich repeat protein [Clostridiales bacterium]
MYLIKKKTTIIALVVLLAIFVGAITLTQVIDTASAATIESYDDLDFKLVTNDDGSQSYSVSLKVAYRRTAEFVVIPNTYNGLPVTEIAASGFMSCTKLTKVVLPKSIVTIGKNAFMNCTSLEYIAMPGVETIGDSAFSMCTKLERLYFPLSVKSVGTAILRNNSNTIYLQGSQEEIDRLWSSTWNSYFTGETVENVEPSDMIQYRPILGMDNQTVVGYEIQEYQNLSSGDIVIYNMIKTEDNPEYLPVLNICSEAFTGSVCDSLTIKDLHEDDPSVPEFTHKINIRSNAFLLAIIDEIDIQVGVTFNHPQELQQNVDVSMLDDEPITGDANGHSTRVFEESLIQSVTLPADIDIITERMFKNCVFLESIKINGEDYDGTNVLPN